MEGKKKIYDIVIDTDAFNEVDDQFAIAYSIFSSESVSIKAFYAAPFVNEHAATAESGMEQSYDEILHIIDLCKKSGSYEVKKGAEKFLEAVEIPAHTEATDDLINRAKNYSEEDPLYVVAIGAPTNIASALILCPEIASKIVVLWLGGHIPEREDTKEYNLEQDLISSRTLLDSDVPLVLFPCEGVIDKLKISPKELKKRLGHGTLSDYLIHIVEQYEFKEFSDEKVIWDVVPFSWLIVKDCVQLKEDKVKGISDDCRWIDLKDSKRYHYAKDINPEIIFDDLFLKIANK